MYGYMIIMGVSGIVPRFKNSSHFQKDYVKIYLTTEQRPVLTLMTLKKLEEELPKNNFMRVHRSYIVALDKIEQIERNQLIINNQRINISEAYRNHFRKFMDDNQFL